jgi:hypothetical protein
MINLYCSRADYLKKANFEEICILKGFEQFYGKAVNRKKYQ